MIKNQCKLDQIIRIEIIINLRGALSQKFNIFIYHIFYSDNTKITNGYDDNTFTPKIALDVQFLAFLSEKLL